MAKRFYNLETVALLSEWNIFCAELSPSGLFLEAVNSTAYLRLSEFVWVVSAPCLRFVESTTNGTFAYRFILWDAVFLMARGPYSPPLRPTGIVDSTVFLQLLLFHHLLTIPSFFHFGTMVRYLLFYRVNYVSFCWNWDSQPLVHLARCSELESCRVKFVLRVKNLFRNKDELNRRKFISQTSMIL